MRSIEEMLDTATPSQITPPTVESLRQTVRRRARRRRAAVLAATGCLAVVVGAGVWDGLRERQRVESVDEAPINDGEQGVQQLTPTTASEITADDRATTPESIWASRWFLVPPDSIKIVGFDSQSQLGSQVQTIFSQGPILTSNPQDPASARLARTYHLEGDQNIFRIGDPTWDYYEVVRFDRQIRIGNEPEGDGVDAFVASDDGRFVVVAEGISDQEAIDLVLSARLVQGRTELVGPLPDGFVEVAEPNSGPADHVTRVTWNQHGIELTLQASRQSIEKAVLGRRFGQAELVEIRGTTGVFTPAKPGQDGASLVWAEDGYAFRLQPRDERTPVDLATLASVAEELQRHDQTSLVERLDDQFMARQATVVAEWLAATPLPPGWDPEPVVNMAPVGELRGASRVHGYLQCAWTVEWANAVRTGDDALRVKAEAVLADEPNWLVFQARFEAYADADGRYVERREHTIEEVNTRAERMASVSSSQEADDLFGNPSCG